MLSRGRTLDVRWCTWDVRLLGVLDIDGAGLWGDFDGDGSSALLVEFGEELCSCSEAGVVALLERLLAEFEFAEFDGLIGHDGGDDGDLGFGDFLVSEEFAGLGECFHGEREGGSSDGLGPLLLVEHGYPCVAFMPEVGVVSVSGEFGGFTVGVALEDVGDAEGELCVSGGKILELLGEFGGFEFMAAFVARCRISTCPPW